jgi:hypothetical protein
VEVFVVLTLALALAALATAAVAARHLGRTARRLNAAVTEAADRIVPLVEELEAEAAVTAVEVEHLSARGKTSEQEA